MIKSAAKPDTLVSWMEALADRTRLRILRVLERQELGVVELCDVLQMPQSTVSRHLKILLDQGWLRDRRQGATNFYRVILDELEPAARKLWVVAREQTENWATIRQDELRLRRRLNNRAPDSQTFFAGAAGRWDKLRRELYGESFVHHAMLAMLPATYVVADLGCGTGELIEHLSPFVKRVIGVDNSAAMLKAARKRLSDAKNIELIHSDLAEIPLPDNSCDVVLAMLVLTYVSDVDAVLREANRIVKPGGIVVIVDLLPHDRDDFRREMGHVHAGFAADELGDRFTANDLQETRVLPMTPDTTAKGPALFLATATKPLTQSNVSTVQLKGA